MVMSSEAAAHNRHFVRAVMPWAGVHKCRHVRGALANGLLLLM
jgi:hypothetical protein